MERWIIYAFISMSFAGFTAVIAKQGLVGISAELGLTLRTLFVSVFVIVFGLMTVSPIEVKSVDATLKMTTWSILNARQQ